MQLVCAYGVAMDENCSQLKSEGTKLTQLIAMNTLEFAHPMNNLRHSCMYGDPFCRK
jgi:hypothetical protein